MLIVKDTHVGFDSLALNIACSRSVVNKDPSLPEVDFLNILLQPILAPSVWTICFCTTVLAVRTRSLWLIEWAKFRACRWCDLKFVVFKTYSWTYFSHLCLSMLFPFFP